MGSVRVRLSFTILAFTIAINLVIAQPLVRLASINVDSLQLNDYNRLLKEEIATSIEVEPGVITLCAVAEKLHPTRILIFETYADSSQYRAHLKTSHFLKYKTGTANMVTGLQLTEVNQIAFAGKRQKIGKQIFIRLIRLQIDETKMGAYPELLREVLDTSIVKEPGALLTFAVNDKAMPSTVTILEVYASEKDAQAHLQTPHYLAYKQATANMIRSRQVIDAVPVLLGRKY